jgi:hypothetical protein
MSDMAYTVDDERTCIWVKGELQKHSSPITHLYRHEYGRWKRADTLLLQMADRVRMES